VAKPKQVEFEDGTVIPILYEDRAVLALDKPAGWMLAPDSWTKTSRNLQLALERSIRAGDFWARARGLRFLRFVHRLDAGTTGIVLFARSQGALGPFSNLFQSRQVEKRYLAVIHGVPKSATWECALPLGPHRRLEGVTEIDRRAGKPAETHFRLLQAGTDTALVEAHPLTGRMHQIRVHLAAAGHPVLGDELYWRQFQPSAPARTAAPPAMGSPATLALRAVFLAYPDPFSGRWVRIAAPFAEFVRQFGFAPESAEALAWRQRRKN